MKRVSKLQDGLNRFNRAENLSNLQAMSFGSAKAGYRTQVTVHGFVFNDLTEKLISARAGGIA